MAQLEMRAQRYGISIEEVYCLSNTTASFYKKPWASILPLPQNMHRAKRVNPTEKVR